jgi:serine-type D-Ala-D-Ala carboxypeptidase/endopeptidase (penicillin-binding protein 4)
MLQDARLSSFCPGISRERAETILSPTILRENQGTVRRRISLFSMSGLERTSLSSALSLARTQKFAANLLLAGLMCLALAATRMALAQDDASVKAGIKKLVGPAAQGTGIFVLDLSSGRRIFELNPEEALKPASVQKILTSVTALNELGAETAFHTGFYGELSGGYVPKLFVKGAGDPSLTTESLWIIARKLKKLGVRRVGSLKIDSSLFSEGLAPKGQRAYETAPAALAYNYNSVAFDVCPGRAGGPAQISLDPFEAGIQLSGSIKTVPKGGEFEIAEQPIKNNELSSYKASGTISSAEPCATIYRSVNYPEVVFARSLVAALRMLGVEVGSFEGNGVVPAGLNLIYDHSSPALYRIVQDLNHFSTNMIAEQLLFQLGRGADGRLSNGVGLARIAALLKQIGIEPAEFSLADGSGLSHENRVSSEAVVRVLEYAYRNEELRPEFESSLSVADRSGTLKRRKFSLQQAWLRGKTGTLDDVSALAGYLFTRSGRRLAFAILQNQIKSKEQANQLEEAIVRELAKL